MDSDNNKIVLNVGGTRFETHRTTLKKVPATRLSRLTEALANYDSIMNEYFFDRHPGVFSQILNYYRTGKLHYPTNVCGPLFETELEFWGLDMNQVEPCCWKTYTRHRDTQETLATLEKLGLDDDATSPEELGKKFGLDEDSRWQRKTLPLYKRIKPIIWQLLEEPRSSKLAKIIGRISVFFIILSIISYCLSTVVGACPFESYCRSYTLNVFVIDEVDIAKSVIKITAQPNNAETTLLDHIDYTCIAWFTLEFIVRFVVSPDKLDFCKSPLNWIDLLANTWFYADFVINKILNRSINPTEPHPIWDLLGTIRIMRLFKLVNHHKGLRVIIASLKASAGILRLLIFFVCVAVIIFASLIYYCERMATGSALPVKLTSRVSSGSMYNKHLRENDFVSIVEAIWFSIISLTTVGFGDFVPRTPFGMVFGALCTVTGVLMIDLPMPIIVQNFANYYNHLKARSKLPKKLRRKFLFMNNNLNDELTNSLSSSMAMKKCKSYKYNHCGHDANQMNGCKQKLLAKQECLRSDVIKNNNHRVDM